MKLGFFRRCLLLLYWLGSIAAIAFLTYGNLLDGWVEALKSAIGESTVQVLYIVLISAYILLTLLVPIFVIFRFDGKRSERGFISVDSSDNGKVRIAVSAIEMMVRQAVDTVEGIHDMKISIANMEDAVAIHVNTSILNGVHVPTVTLNMQRAIRQFVEMNCGVSVRNVMVDVIGVISVNENGKKSRRQTTAVTESVTVDTNETLTGDTLRVPSVSVDTEPMEANAIEEIVPVEEQRIGYSEVMEFENSSDEQGVYEDDTSAEASESHEEALNEISAEDTEYEEPEKKFE